MNEVQVLIDKCRKHGQATLRGIWPGRGRAVTERRANVKKAFGDQQVVKENRMVKNDEGIEVEESVVIATIVFDKPRGVYLLAS
jgi:hypothetical protein